MSQTPTQSLFVKPKTAGARVPKEDGTPLHQDGEEVPRNVFWKRRLSGGDVVETARPQPKPKK
jgi:hypothetical protein